MESSLFRQVMSLFVSGVTVVTTKGGLGDVHGMTCSAFCSISAAHPSILVCLTSRTRTAQMLQESGAFCVHILAHGQAHIADRFAGRHHDKETDRFANLSWTEGTLGVPVLSGVRAYLECRLAKVVDYGDHSLCIGDVAAAAFEPSLDPLVYSQGAYFAGIGPPKSAEP